MIVSTLADLLAQRGISQRELARRSCVNRATVARLCHGKWTKIDRYAVACICRCLRITLGELFVWQE